MRKRLAWHMIILFTRKVLLALNLEIVLRPYSLLYLLVFYNQLTLTRISPEGPEVSTQAENPVEFVHSSQTVTAWSNERVIALDREGATWTNTSSAVKGGKNGAKLHLYVLSLGISKMTLP